MMRQDWISRRTARKRARALEQAGLLCLGAALAVLLVGALVLTAHTSSGHTELAQAYLWLVAGVGGSLTLGAVVLMVAAHVYEVRRDPWRQ